MLLFADSADAAGVLEVQAGPGQLAGVSWSGLTLEYRIEHGEQRDWQLGIVSLRAGALPPTDVRLACAAFAWSAEGYECESAELAVIAEGFEPLVLTGIQWHSKSAQHHALRWDGESTRVALDGSVVAGQPGVQLNLENLNLSRLPPALLDLLGLDVLAGELSVRLDMRDQALDARLQWRDGALDGLDGLVAAEGLDLNIELQIDGFGAGSGVRFAGRQSAGEILVGPVYLPAPEAPLVLEMEILPNVLGGSVDGLEIQRFALRDPDSLEAAGTGALVRRDGRWSLDALSLDQLELFLPRFWERWMEGPAAAIGFGGLALAGHVGGQLAWQSGELHSADLSVMELDLADPRNRLAVQGLSASLDGQAGSLRSELAWHSMRLWGLPFGAADAAFQADQAGVRLLRSLEVPLIDGWLAIDSLAWLNRPELSSQLVLDARIEPVSLNLLTRELGLIELGGTLAGQFPGVQYQDERLVFTGGMVIDAFSGQILVDELQVERPFGSLPALAAQVEFQRLDLLELTGAFDFGRMEGRMSGWMRDLRLLDWRLVAMETRLFTHEDVARRRISQRAVDNLSRLGGGGGALLSGTLLRVFEDFPYRRAGLACRLSNNICYLDGVAPHPSGGFLIVEGRGLPRLDVVGHRRLVDWPQLLDQLERIVAQD